VAIGLVVGQAVLDADSNRLANSGAIWVSVAFGIRTVMASDREAVVAGLGTLLLAVVGYQLAALIANASLGGSAIVIWSGTAVVGGPMFGLVGRRWQAGPVRPASSRSRCSAWCSSRRVRKRSSRSRTSRPRAGPR
jgi:hypothetical protein